VRTILIVDDDPLTVDQFSRMLRLEGYHVVAASDGAEGLERALLERPDAMILDLRMPIMDGTALLEQFRSVSHLRNVPAVIVTGDYSLDEATLDRLHALGAQVQYKPLWIDDLVGIVNSLLGGEKAP
jgi:twitching motility two-component system response regulator PilH